MRFIDCELELLKVLETCFILFLLKLVELMVNEKVLLKYYRETPFLLSISPI